MVMFCNIFFFIKKKKMISSKFPHNPALSTEIATTAKSDS